MNFRRSDVSILVYSVVVTILFVAIDFTDQGVGIASAMGLLILPGALAGGVLVLIVHRLIEQSKAGRGIDHSIGSDD